MGIQGLLVGLKPFTQQGNLMDYADQSLAVDTSSWMHKSIYSIADHYVECQEALKIDERCIRVSTRYLTQRCRELHDGFRIQKICLVMDGKRCPLKAITNQERDDRRRENLRLARTYKRQQRHEASFEKYKSCIKIVNALTIPVVKRVAQQLPYVELIWSPYEADAQLAQLCIERRVVACITEDSDVLVYSAAAQVSFPIIYKLDRNTGNADIVAMDWLLDASGLGATTTTTTAKDHPTSSTQLGVVLSILQSRQKQIPGWGARLFVMGCVLAGCDYAPRQILGVGLVKAFKLVREAGITGSDKNLAKVFRYILTSALNAKSRGSVKNSDALEEQLAQAEAVFYYHPVQRKDGRIVHFTSHETRCAPNLDRFADCSFLGSLVANENEDSGIIPKCFRVRSPNTTRPTRTPKAQDKNRDQRVKSNKPVEKGNVQATPPRQCRVLKSPSSATSSLSSPSMGNGNSGVIPNFVTVSKKTVNNPYTKSGAHEQRRKNAFESYRRRHENPEAIDRIRQIVQTKLPVRRQPEVNVRGGVKRKFPKLPADITQPKRSRLENDGEVIHKTSANDAPYETRPKLQTTVMESSRRDLSQDVYRAPIETSTGFQGSTSDDTAQDVPAAMKNESPFVPKSNTGAFVGSKDRFLTEKRPGVGVAVDRDDHHHRLETSSPNLLLEPSPLDDDDVVECVGFRDRNVRRVTMAQPPVINDQIGNPSLPFSPLQSSFHCTPAASRPTRDHADRMIETTPQGLHREHSHAIATQSRDRSSRHTFPHLKSFLSHRRKKDKGEQDRTKKTKHRQSSILSHFKFR